MTRQVYDNQALTLHQVYVITRAQLFSSDIKTRKLRWRLLTMPSFHYTRCAPLQLSYKDRGGADAITGQRSRLSVSTSFKL